MPPRLFVLLLILKISDGFTYSDTSMCRDTTFPENLEQFLNNKNHSIISSNCKNHLLIYAEDLKLQKEWAINMLDAGAKNLSPGVLSGNLVDLGNFDACLNIEEHKNNFQITGKYCIGNTLIASNKFQTKSTLISANSLYTAPSTNGTISLYLARCFPAVCSGTEMQNVYTAIDIQLTFSTNLCQTKATQPKINTAAYIFGCITVFLICLSLYGTSLDLISLHLERERPHQMITAFSLFENGRKLLEISNSATDISCIHGIRVLSCMWLVLFHRHFLSAQLPISNFFYYRDWFKSLVNMLIHSAPLAVDTFFLLFGLFVAYNYMINISKGMKFNIVSYYTQRYLRLTPVLVMMLLVLNVAIHVSSGPLWVNVMATDVTNCEISWWRNLLYIQNIYMDGRPVCYLHTWYLSADMQLFILSPLILNPLRKWPKQMLLLIGFLGTCSMIVSFAIGWIYLYNAVAMANEHLDEFLWNYYFPVYTRATPWLIGFVLGYFLATHKGDNVNALKRKETVYALWICAVIVLLGCVFVGHGLIANEHKRFISALHMTLVRPIWALAMSWVIFACVNGYAGPLNLFLSLPIFQILSKLTYSLYMVHPLIINLSVLQMRAPPFLSTFDMLHKFWGDFALSLAAALLLWIGIENPVSTIYKYLTSPKKKVE